MNHIDNKIIVNILWKNLNADVLTAREQEELDHWLAESVHNRNVFGEMADTQKWNEEVKLLLSRDSQATWEKILQAIETTSRTEAPEAGRIRKINVRFVRYAAAVLVAALAGAYFLYGPSQKEEATTVKTIIDKAVDAILPGSHKAVLTLADGSVIDLAKTGGRIDSKNNNIRITNNLQEGELVFDAAGSLLADDQLPITLNTLSIPRGGSYRVILPDGSKIWLNAASTLRFPILFSNKERTVELTGEAYFEVEPVFLSAKFPPFHVKANGVDINVLGTQFNVKAYTDEHQVATTLERGAVVVSKGGQVCQLKPGEQARVTDELPVKPIRREKVDAKEFSLWKNGYFSFTGLPIEDIMNQISRWYDVEVVFNGAKPGDTFSGAVNRNISISGIIKLLQINGMDAKIDKRKLVVTAHKRK